MQICYNETMNSVKKVVITYGTFDLMHYGHIILLKRAKKLGNYLIVALSTDEFNKIKGKQSFFNYEERKKMLSLIKCVDKIIPEYSWNQKINDIKKYNVKYFVMGDDWKGKFDYLNEFCDVVYFRRTPDISSTKIKKKIIKDII